MHPLQQAVRISVFCRPLYVPQTCPVCLPVCTMASQPPRSHEDSPCSRPVPIFEQPAVKLAVERGNRTRLSDAGRSQ